MKNETMKRFISVLIAVVLTLGICMMTACGSGSSVKHFKITLVAEEGGTVNKQENITISVVEGGEETIKAEPLPGYMFIEWDDGNTEAVRTITVTEDKTYTAKFGVRTYELQYMAGEHGRIEGKSEQGLLYLEDGEEVTAIPDEGFMFTGWTDGVRTASRKDTAVEGDIYVTAMFEQLKKTYYCDLADLYPQEKMELKYGETDGVKFPVPARAHFTFHGWKLNGDFITDAQGNLTVGDDIFNKKGNIVEGDWMPDAEYEYKILMVYVTEFKATLTKCDKSGTVDVDYKMSDFERQLCHVITQKYRDFMNETMDGLVKFKIDEYFTTQPLGKEHVTIAGGVKLDGTVYMDNLLYADKIPEVQDKLDDYRTVMVTFNLNDYDSVLHTGAGVAAEGTIFGCYYLDSAIKKYNIAVHEPLENLLNMDHLFWMDFIDALIHETIHTMESYYYHHPDSSLLHDAWDIFISYGDKDNDGNNNSDLHLYKLFLLEEAPLYGQKMGVPYRYWQGILE